MSNGTLDIWKDLCHQVCPQDKRISRRYLPSSNFMNNKSLSGPKLGRPSKETTKTDKQIEYQDNTDRIEVERRFSLTKRCYGMGKIVTRLEDTQLTSIALSVFVANIVRMQQRILSALFYLLDILKFQEGWLPACAG